MQNDQEKPHMWRVQVRWRENGEEKLSEPRFVPTNHAAHQALLEQQIEVHRGLQLEEVVSRVTEEEAEAERRSLAVDRDRWARTA